MSDQVPASQIPWALTEDPVRNRLKKGLKLKDLQICVIYDNRIDNIRKTSKDFIMQQNTLKKFNQMPISLSLITAAGKRNCGNVMFSQVSVCPPGGEVGNIKCILG